MSQTIITLAFEQYKAQQEAVAAPVELDEFVLANVPNQDAALPIDRNEGLPSQAQIVFVGNVSQDGYVNPNAVVYSLIMDTRIGDFDFNWIGLRNKASGVIAAISHIPTVYKLKTILGVQNGNSVTRSIMMSYSDAMSLTNIDVDASTWQIDFTARLFGMDEAERLANVDHYGHATFLADGYQVFKSGSTYKTKKGTGYVGGLRCHAESDLVVSNVKQSSAIYLDASWQGQITSQWQTVVSLISSTSVLTDYTDNNGFLHYVTKIADVDSAGDVIDVRFIGGSNEFERKDNAATDTDIDNNSTAGKHVKLTQLWRAISNKISAAFLSRSINTTGALKGGGDLSENRTLSIESASTAKEGVVQLSGSLYDTSTEKAATADALKRTYAKAGSAYNLAATKADENHEHDDDYYLKHTMDSKISELVRKDNSASDADIDNQSQAQKQVNLPQFWRGIIKIISENFESLGIGSNSPPILGSFDDTGHPNGATFRTYSTTTGLYPVPGENGVVRYERWGDNDFIQHYWSATSWSVKKFSRRWKLGSGGFGPWVEAFNTENSKAVKTSLLYNNPAGDGDGTLISWASNISSFNSIRVTGFFSKSELKFNVSITIPIEAVIASIGTQENILVGGFTDKGTSTTDVRLSLKGFTQTTAIVSVLNQGYQAAITRIEGIKHG